MDTATATCLHEMARSHGGVVLSLPFGGELRHHKSRLVGTDAESLWVETPATAEEALLDEMIQTGRPAAISFKHAGRRAMFAARLCARDPAYLLNRWTDATVAALRLAMPGEIRFAQRRAHYRAPVDVADVQVRVWRVAETANLAIRPGPEQELIVGRPTDLSVGGMGVLFDDMGDRWAGVVDGERVRVEFGCALGTLLLEGRIRRSQAEPNGPQLRCGIRWVNRPESRELRRALGDVAKLVSLLEREQLRRARRGLAGLG
jgi:c-di-GMP-binding flagellar brake protein YcgR